MKDYTKLIKEISKDPNYEFHKDGRKCTVKLVHLPTNSMYSVHPGDKAVKPLKQWMAKLNKQENGKT